MENVLLTQQRVEGGRGVCAYFGQVEAASGEFGSYPVFGASEFLAVWTVTD